MANVFRISRTLGVLEHLGSAPLRVTTMLIHWLDLDMVSGSRRRWMRYGAGRGDPYRSRRWVKFRVTGSSGGRILKKKEVQILAGLGERPQWPQRPPINCGSVILHWFCCREAAFQWQLCSSAMHGILVECRESREEIKWKLRKLVNVWFFELVQYGKSSWTNSGLPGVLNHRSTF